MSKWFAAACIAGSCLLMGCAPKAPVGGVISVNGTWILQSDIDKVAEMVKADMVRNAPEQALGSAATQARKMVVKQLVANELLLQIAKTKQIPMDPVRVDSTMAGFKERFPDEATFKAELARSGQTEEALKKQIQDGTMIDSLMRSLLVNIDTVSEEQCSKFYVDNPSYFVMKNKMHLRHLLVGVASSATAKDKDATKKKAQDLLVKLKGGADFAKTAQQHSTSPDAKNGGDIGWFSKGDLQPELENAALPLKKGGISGLIESPAGFHIVKKEDEQASMTMPYDSVKAKIKLNLGMEKKQKFVGNYVDSLMAQAKIVYKDSLYMP